MNGFLTTVLLFVGALVQSVLPVPEVFGSTEWPILLSLTLCVSLRVDRPHAGFAGLLAGVLHDSFCPILLGVSVPFFLFVALGANALRKEIFGEQFITYAVLGLLGALLQTLYFTFIFSVSGWRPLPIGPVTVRLFGSSLLGLVSTPLVFLLISRLPSGRLFRQRRWIA